MNRKKENEFIKKMMIYTSFILLGVGGLMANLFDFKESALVLMVSGMSLFAIGMVFM